VLLTMKTKRRTPTGEAELFRAIWGERPHICTNCKVPLGEEAKVFFFSHIKGKGAHPELRLDKENIQLLCWQCHTEYDHGSREKYENRKDINLGKEVVDEVNYRGFYFASCDMLATIVLQMSGEYFTKQEIHLLNKQQANTQTTKDLTNQEWETFLEAVSEYWENKLNVNIF